VADDFTPLLLVALKKMRNATKICLGTLELFVFFAAEATSRFQFHSQSRKSWNFTSKAFFLASRL